MICNDNDKILLLLDKWTKQLQWEKMHGYSWWMISFAPMAPSLGENWNLKSSLKVVFFIEK